MSQLNIVVNGKSYTIACDDGQEEHLLKLVQFLNGRVDELASAMGQVGDMRLLLMAGLTIADELSDAYAEVKALKQELVELQEEASDTSVEDAYKALIDRTIDRIGSLAEKIELPQSEDSAAQDADEQVIEENVKEEVASGEYAPYILSELDSSEEQAAADEGELDILKDPALL